MALVKTTKLAGKSGSRANAPASPDAVKPAVAAPAPRPPAQKRGPIQREKVAERIGAATEELASGVQEAASAAEELRRALEQIASGAEEAASAAQESLAGVTSLGSSFTDARNLAQTSRDRTEALQTLLIEAGVQIETSVEAIETNAARQLDSVEVINTLEKQAADIGEITRIVAEISDQTNLLALNAAIEAARAGDHGRGFAIVADEVRLLAEASEKSAHDIQDLADGVVRDVRIIASRIRGTSAKATEEVKSGRAVVELLGAMRSGMKALGTGAEAILIDAVEAETAILETRKGGEQVASAAEEQAAAAAEAQRSVQQQTEALEESQQAARALARLAEELHSGKTTTGTGQVAATAEQLSSAVQEISGAAGEILTALDQINRGAQMQAAATQQANAAMTQIEKAASNARQISSQAVDRIGTLTTQLGDARQTTTQLVANVAEALAETRNVIEVIASLEESGRKIERIVEAIGLVAVQTTMLAVSGSIEAARAGDFGRGFATVSGDIRGLARDAAENSSRIRDMVQTIRDHIVLTRRELEQIVLASDGEIRKHQAIIQKLATAETDIAQVSQGSSVIVAGTETILSALGEVLAGTRQIAAAAEQASSASTQAATAAREQARGAEDLAAAIEEIALLANELQVTEA